MSFRTLLIIVLVLLTSQLAWSQYDASYYNKSADGEQTHIFWLTYFGDKAMFDVRYDFDWGNTFTAFVGKTYGSQKLSITPAVGILRGGYEGISAEAYFGGGLKGKFSFFSLWQYATCTASTQFTDWTYQWTDVYYQVSPFVTIGLGEQVYYEVDGGFNTVDLGPTAKIQIGPVYLKPWYTFSLTKDNPDKLFFGVGYNF